MGPVTALTSGIRRALTCWPAWVMLFLATLLVAVPLALFPAGSLLETARRPVIEDMMSGFKTWQIIDMARLVMKGQQAADQPGMNDVLTMQNVVYLGLLTLLLPLLGGFVSSFFWGGVLITYREAGQDAKPFRLSRFFWGCWHWFGSFLLLGVVQAGLTLAVSLPLIALFGGASALGTAGSVAGLVIIILFAVLWMALFETARVQCVVTDTRNIFSGIGRAFRLIFGRFLPFMGFYLLALLVLLLVHLAFRAALMPIIPAEAVLVTLAAQQAFILARLFAQALRLAGLTALAQGYQRDAARPASVMQNEGIEEPVQEAAV